MNPERTERGHTNRAVGGLLEGDLDARNFLQSMTLTTLPGLRNLDLVTAIRAVNTNVENGTMWVTG